MFCGIIICNTFEFAASWIYAYDMRKSISLIFKGFSWISPTFLKIPNFPDQAQKSLTFPWPWISLTSGNPANRWNIITYQRSYMIANIRHCKCNQQIPGSKISNYLVIRSNLLWLMVIKRTLNVSWSGSLEILLCFIIELANIVGDLG